MEKEQEGKKQPDSASLIRTIVLGADWEESLTAIVVEQGIDPLNIDISRLAGAFMVYLNRMKSFDFRMPARFILIAAILLNMKCEALLQKEEERLDKLAQAAAAQLNLSAPLLTPPVDRHAARPVSLTDLISALNKAFEIKRCLRTGRLRRLHRHQLHRQFARHLPAGVYMQVRLSDDIDTNGGHNKRDGRVSVRFGEG